MEKPSRILRSVFFASIMSMSFAVSAQFQPFQPLPEQPPIPADNPMSPAKVELGKQLFFDPRLSVNHSTSCNSCHNVMSGGADNRVLSVGATGKQTKRNAATLYNVAYQTIFFRDGAALSMEHAIDGHIVDETTMAMSNKEQVVERIHASEGYRAAFVKVYGDKEPVTYDNIVKSLAAYIRTLKTQDSPFDQYLRGDSKAISEQAKRGMGHFIELACASCHFYVNMAGPIPGIAFQVGEGFYELFPNHLGSKYDAQYRLTEDIGRFQITHDETDKHMWRVASLRNVAVTAPYFHNGSVATLDEAIRVMGKVQMKQDLSDEVVADIKAYLETLTGEFPQQTMPRLPQ